MNKILEFLLAIFKNSTDDTDPSRYYSYFDNRPGSHLQMLDQKEALKKERRAGYKWDSGSPKKISKVE